MTDYQVKRLKEKLIRLAYEMEYDASRLRYSGKNTLANEVLAISRQLGNAGRS